MKCARAVGVLCAAALAACEGIGRPVVDNVEPPVMGMMSSVCAPVRCDPPAGERQLSPELAAHLRDPLRAECGGTALEACMLAPSTGDADGSSCLGRLTDPEQLSNQQLDCADIELALPVVQGECAFTLPALSLERSTLRLRAGAGCAVTLPGLRARQARIELEGPVELIIERRAELEDVSFSGERTAAGAPLLELDLSSGTRVVIGDEAQPFEGGLNARHTRLRHSTIDAEEVGLESVLFYDARLSARDVDADDAVFEQAVLDLDHAVLSASALKSTDLRACGPMLIAGSALTHVVLRSCGDDLIRIYTSAIGSSFLDGWIESDSSSFESVRFGSGAPTDFVQYGGSLYKSAFCGSTRSYRVGQGAGTSCMRCDEPGTFQPGGACKVSETSTIAADRTDCPAFQQLAACDGEDEGAGKRPRPWPNDGP